MITYQKWFKISAKIKTNHQLLWEKYFSTKKCIANQFLYRMPMLQFASIRLLLFPSTYKPQSLFSFNKTSEVQFYNSELITCNIFSIQFTSFDRISCLLIKHYKCDALSWADTNGALGFDWRKVLYTDVANTYDRMIYQPPRTSW